MLRIQRSCSEEVVFTLSGRIESEDLTELQGVIGLEQAGHHLVLDLEDVTLVDRDAVKFLARCEENEIDLKNCPPYIRQWVSKERHRSAVK
jgi:hypothetical protein